MQSHHSAKGLISCRISIDSTHLLRFRTCINQRGFPLTVPSLHPGCLILPLKWNGRDVVYTIWLVEQVMPPTGFQNTAFVFWVQIAHRICSATPKQMPMLETLAQIM